MNAQHTPGPRLSEKQREFLADVAASETPTDDHPQGIPFYLRHTHMEFQFNTASERERWYRNLETRGLIVRTGNGRCFVRLTDVGRAALSQPATEARRVTAEEDAVLRSATLAASKVVARGRLAATTETGDGVLNKAQVCAALANAGLMLVKTEHGLRVEKAVTGATAYSVSATPVAAVAQPPNVFSMTEAAVDEELRSLGIDPDEAPARVQSAITDAFALAEQMRTAKAGSMCPLCGVAYPHEHSPEEITIYRNGMKASPAAVAQPVAGRLLKAFGARTAFKVGDRALPLMLGPNWKHQFCSGDHNEWLCIRFNSTEERDEFRAAAKDWENVTRDEMEAPGTACTACGDSGVVTDAEGRNWPCYRHCAALAASPSSERQDVGGDRG